MLEIKSVIYKSYAKTSEGRSRVTVEMFADTVSDLPEVDGIDGYTLCMSSIAYVIMTGEMYVLGSDGTWHNSENGSTPQVQEIANLDETTAEPELNVKTETAPEIVTTSEPVPETVPNLESVDFTDAAAEEGDSNDESV